MVAVSPRVYLDPWPAEYESALGLGEPDEAPPPVDVSVETQRWAPVRPSPERAPEAIVFVDGVRRAEQRLFVEDAEGATHPGLLGSFAVGAAESARGGRILDCLVGRLSCLAGGRSAPPIEAAVGAGTLFFRSETAPEAAPGAPLPALSFLQLDDVVVVDTPLPDGSPVRFFGVVDLVRARHEGARSDSDVFLVERGVLPVSTATAEHARVSRVEPEVFVPPAPGRPVRRAAGVDRDQALFFDAMERRLPVGLARYGQPVFANLDFLDGTRGAHVNVSGISGVATKTTYATFLLHSLFTSGALGPSAATTHALIFNVKGEDLLFVDQPNRRLSGEDREAYARLGLPATAFDSVQILSPVRRGSRERLPDTGSRLEGVQAFFWTLRELAEERLLRFLFAERDEAGGPLALVAEQVEQKLRAAVRDNGASDPGLALDGQRGETFEDLVEAICERLDGWVRAPHSGTLAAFERRLRGATGRVGHLLRGRDVGRREVHRLDWRRRQVSVVDIHALHDAAKRFVVGAVLKRMFEEKEALGTARPLVFVVLDELNKYAPRDGSSPLKDVLADVSERGRSLLLVLVGAQQTASEVEPRLVANAALRVVGRLDAAESERGEYAFRGFTEG